MSGTRGSEHPGDEAMTPDGLIRWECRHHRPPILLGAYDPSGQIHIKVRNRHWHILGTVHTRCPRCGAEHALDLRVDSRVSEVESRACGGTADAGP